MTGRNSLIAWFATGTAAGLCPIAASISAAPLLYDVVAAESNGYVQAVVVAEMDVSPDFTELLPGGDDFPFGAGLIANGDTAPSPQSTVTADVGLPGSFDDGANGISFSDLSIVFQNFPGPFTGFGFVSVPLDLTGTASQLAGATATVSSFSIVLDAPLTASLTPTGNPNEWLWAGAANVTLSGNLAPAVTLPASEPVPLTEVPFSQAVTIPLAGTFSLLPVGTQVTVGIPLGTLQNQDLSLPPIDEEFDLGGLGLVTASFSFSDLVFADFSTAVVYRNLTPIPEPGTAALLALGLGGLAVRRRR